MIYIPFICLALGAIINWRGLPAQILKKVDDGVNLALVLLMVVIGMNIGINQSVMSKLGVIGINCVVIALTAIACSIFFTFIAEKTVMPLEKLSSSMKNGDCSEIDALCEDKSEEKKGSPLIFLMPGSIIAGLLVGWLFMGAGAAAVLDKLLVLSLIILYIGVGVSLASNKRVFVYIKKLGLRILFLPLAIFIGSFVGGFISGAILGLGPEVSVMSSSGMSYYSITGAFMTQQYGIEVGTYGFIVNVMREFFTVALLPLIVKISKGSPIAAGAAGGMDTMLVPVTKFVGTELGLVTLVNGVILTVLVPVILPIISNIV